MEQAQLDALRDILQKERASIAHTLEEYGALPGEEGMHVEANDGFADSGQATAERSQSLGMIEQLQDAWRDLSEALGRIDEGTYGKCDRCGRDIPFERLEARPATTLCVTCKQRAGA
ncbi:MAG TPA: TraR/DksA C4-type zinc finger protein [Actinomycetota bacterium]|nr:TraR/DksA C4-type zinc finger protein [Actinomycetota bacterium]